MAPRAASREQINRSKLLHALLVTAIVIAMVSGLVFNKITANRDGNETTTPALVSPSPIPHLEKSNLRQVTFGSLFLPYLILKAFEITTPISRFLLKTWLDEISLLVGGLSLVAVVCITSIQFALKVVLPAYGIVFMYWVLSRTGRFERVYVFFYDKYLERKRSSSFHSLVRDIRTSPVSLELTRPNLAYNDSCKKNSNPLLSVQQLESVAADIEENIQVLISAREAVIDAWDRINQHTREWDAKIIAAATNHAPETETPDQTGGYVTNV